MAEFDDELDDYDDDREDGNCHWCAGEGWSECSDPIECTREHRTYTSPAGVLYLRDNLRHMWRLIVLGATGRAPRVQCGAELFGVPA